MKFVLWLAMAALPLLADFPQPESASRLAEMASAIRVREGFKGGTPVWVRNDGDAEG